MANSWDEEEELTVVEDEEEAAQAEAEKEDETVAFARKSSLFPQQPRRKSFEEADSSSSGLSPFDTGRFPLHAALPRDRFAAFFVDSVALTYLFLALQSLLQAKLFSQAWFLNLSLRWPFLSGLSLWLIGFALVLLYYVAFEALSGSTPGKYLCRLKVVDLDGGPPTLANVFLRNLCRLFDYPLFFGVAVLSMESSRFYQRLGDRAARTVVIKKPRKKAGAVDLRGITLASTFVRAFGFFLDLLFFGAFLWFYLSSARPQSPLFPWMMALFPLLALGYFMIFEMFVSSTPGKILLKRQSILENGETLDNSAALLRNLLRPVDIFLAYFLLALSRRKQRLGDYLAETLVIKKEPEKRAAIALGILLALLALLIFTASRNPDRKWFHQQIPSISVSTPHAVSKPKATAPALLVDAPPVPPSTKPSPVATKPRTGAKPQSTSTAMKVSEFYLSAGPDPTQIRSDAVFHPGDLVFAFFKLSGFQKPNGGKVELVEDVQIEAPNGELLVDKSNVVSFSQSLGDKAQNVLFANQILLPPNPQTGSYKVLLILRDLNSGGQLVYEKNFMIQ